MPFLAVKYATTGSDIRAYRKGSWLIGPNDKQIGNPLTPAYGPSQTTGYWASIVPDSGGYTLYIDNPSGSGPSIYGFASGSALLSFCNAYLGANKNTVAEVIDWLDTQNGYAFDPPLTAILFVGAFNTRVSTTVNFMAKVSQTNVLNTTFLTNNGAGFNNQITYVDQFADGKLLCIGTFTTFNNVSRTRIARLNPDGTLDTTFVVGTGLNGTPVSAVIDEPAQRIYVSGAFTQYNGVSTSRVVRLMYDGTLDTTFTTTFDNTTQGMDLDANFLYVSGTFLNVNSTSCLRIAKINKRTGALVSTQGVGLNGDAIFVRVDPNDSNFIYVGAITSFTSFNGVTIKQNLVKINTTTWQADTTFNNNISAFNARTARVDFDGSGNLILSGSFTNYASTGRSYIVKLTSTGTIVSSFAPTSPNGGLRAAVFLSNFNKIALSGQFTSYAGTTADRCAVIDVTTGAVDSNFNSNYFGSNQDGQMGIEVQLRTY